MRRSIALVFLVLTACPAVVAQSRSHLLRIDGKYQYVRGMNLAWLNGCYGHDFGSSPAHREWGTGFNASDLDDYFADMARMNVNVVRIFVFESFEGIEFDANGYATGIEEQLLEHFDTTVELAKKNNLYLYLCLGNGFHNASKNTSDGFYAGVKDVICEVKARRAYINKVVKPFAARYKANKRIFAFDIINEPQFDNPEREFRDWTTMRPFLRECCAAIHSIDPSRLVSSGVGAEEIMSGQVKGLGFNFYDVHSYRDDGVVRSVAELNSTIPVILGEFGPNGGTRPDDEVAKNAVASFLNNARNGGYAGAAYWAYDHPRAVVVDNIHILKGSGSGEWRPAAYVIRDFQWQESRTPVKRSPLRTSTKRKH